MLYAVMLDLMRSDMAGDGKFSITVDMFRAVMVEEYRDAIGMSTEELCERFAKEQNVKVSYLDHGLGFVTFEKKKGAAA